MGVHLLRFGLGRRPAGADGPDRLIGDDQLRGRGAGSGSEPASWRATTPSATPPSRSAALSPTHTMAIRPAATAASALAGPARSVSPWSWRRSEWPTMT